MRWLLCFWVFLGLGLTNGATQEWRQTVNAFCQATNLAPLQPMCSVPLKELTSFSPVAFGWELKNEKGQRAWAIVSLDGQLWELGLGEPWWKAWEKTLKGKILTCYGSFLSDGSWQWLYRGLGGYGLAVQKGMTLRVEGRTGDLWSDGLKDKVFSKPQNARDKTQGQKRTVKRGTPLASVRDKEAKLFVNFGFPAFPTLRSSHATAAAMWAAGEKVKQPKEPIPALIGSLSGVITRCLCDLPEKPWVHELERGLPMFLRARGQNGSVQTFLRSESSFNTVSAALRRNKGALVTFTYRAEQKQKASALLRTEGTTVLAIGYWDSPFGSFLIALSPLPAEGKGKETVKGWEEGVILYRWEGPATNIVVAIVCLSGR